MTPRHILQVNALSTAACAVGLLAFRGVLFPFFGLAAPLLLDIVAIAFLAYAAALALSARRDPVSRRALLTFAALDALWVAFSAVLLLAFWAELEPLGRTALIGVAIVVEVFAALQFRAASAHTGRTAHAA